MDLLTKDISAFPLISFLLSIIIIYLVLKLTEKFVPRLIKRKNIKSAFNRNFSFFELIVWFVYLLAITPFFLKHNLAFGMGFALLGLVILLFVAWYAGRDLIAGFIIKANTGFKINAHIRINDISGRIVAFYPRNFKLINESGEKLLLPYSSFINKKIVFLPEAKERMSARFKLEIHSDLSAGELVSQLKYQIMTHPKAMLNSVPTIILLKQEDKQFTFEIGFLAINTKGVAEIEAFLKANNTTTATISVA